MTTETLTLTYMIQEMAYKKIIAKGISEKQEVLKNFKDLPKVLRQKIQNFYHSCEPEIQCCDCENYFYKLSDINTEEGYLCEPCVEFYDNQN